MRHGRACGTATAWYQGLPAVLVGQVREAPKGSSPRLRTARRHPWQRRERRGHRAPAAGELRTRLQHKTGADPLTVSRATPAREFSIGSLQLLPLSIRRAICSPERAEATTSAPPRPAARHGKRRVPIELRALRVLCSVEDGCSASHAPRCGVHLAAPRNTRLRRRRAVRSRSPRGRRRRVPTAHLAIGTSEMAAGESRTARRSIRSGPRRARKPVSERRRAKHRSGPSARPKPRRIARRAA